MRWVRDGRSSGPRPDCSRFYKAVAKGHSRAVFPSGTRTSVRVMEWTSDQKGGVAELAIAAEAAQLEIGVFRPVMEGERYDLIFDLRPGLLRVQCKWATRRGAIITVPCQSCRRTATGLVARSYSESEIDAIAAYCHELKKCYLLPISLVANRREVSLRLFPTKNNQAQGV